MHIEELIISLLLSKIQLPSWDQQLMLSLSHQCSQGSALTEKQDTLARRILGKNKTSLSNFLQKDISVFLDKPTYRSPLRKISLSKKISISTDDVFGKVARVLFPFNEDYVNVIRKHKNEGTLNHASWNADQKLWIFSLTETNIKFLMEFSEKYEFDVDEEFKDYAAQTNKILVDFEKYVPTLVIEDNIPKLKNINKNMPDLQTTDILEAIFESRKRGIFVWDDNIVNFIENLSNHTTKEFLKSKTDAMMQIDPEKADFSSLSEVIKFMTPSLFVIPGGDELEKLSQSIEFLKYSGINNDEISVMFRLASDTHVNFNNFVKNNGLNSPITEKTKVVVVSGKLPKPVIKSKIKFHSVVNLGFTNAHYTMKDYVKNQENIVFYSHKRETRGFIFGHL
jgi:hypothetical protein